MKPSWLQFLIEFILILILVLGCLFFYMLATDDISDLIVKLSLLIISGITIMLLAIEIMLCSSKFDSLPRIVEGEDKCKRKR